MRGSIAYLHPEFDLCMDLIATERVLVRPLHTATVTMPMLDGALQRLAAGAPSDTKILLDPREN